ncbi:MAG: esterase/lipase family protein [Gammaproteobacteria bacterium]
MIELGRDTLDPMGEASLIGEISIRAAGVSGNVSVYQPTAADSRSETLDSSALATALELESVDTDYIIEFSNTEEIDVGAGVQTRSTSSDHTGIEIAIPAAGENYGQIVLVTDENGVATWHLPVASDGQVDTQRSGDSVTFVIPGYAAESSDGGTNRGVLGYLGKKVVRALSFRIIDKVAGEVGEFFAKRWEAKKRPYGIRSFTPENYRDPEADPAGADDWSKLAGGPALLFVHGTFSRAFTAFQLLPPDAMQAFYDRYEGRVFAFDHMTVSVDPTDNAAWFVRNLPDDIDLTVDIVCHSRGGHVSRILSERQARLPMQNRKLNVRKIVFVASPNGGTTLADADYMGDFVDAHTNILSLLPDNAITDTLEVIITVLKQLAVGALKGLDGLQSMKPEGAYLRDVLNQPGSPASSDYYAIASDFEPTTDSFGPWAKDRLLDKIFQQRNDLVVPTSSVYAENGSAMFPIRADRLLELGEADGAHHGSFFRNPRAVGKLGEWLSG